MPNLYETTRLLDEYLLFHYGSAEEIMPWAFGPADALHFPVRTVSTFLDNVPRDRALDLGCAVGRSTFELSRTCREVIGLDYSRSFIAAAETLRTTGYLDYNCLEEAGRSRKLTAQRPKDCQPEHVSFEQGDAMNLREDIGTFDLVHAANLLCRLSEPAQLLRRLPALVRPGGLLILTTPCTWLEEFTPADRWPAGSTLEWLKATLNDHFSFEKQINLPFLIREHARKFQWSVALGSVWTRKSPQNG